MEDEVKRGEVYYVRLDTGVGREEGARRPAVIVSSERGNLSAPIVNACYLTTKQKWGKINVPVDATGRLSWVMCNQIATIDKSRLLEKIGELDDSEMGEVDDGIRIALGLMGSSDRQPEIDRLAAKVAELNEKLLKQTVVDNLYEKLYKTALDELAKRKFEFDLHNIAVEEPVEEEETAQVEINTCTFGELREIGVDGDMARKIMIHRPYRSVEDMKIIPGMKSVMFAILRNKVCCIPKSKEPVKKVVAPCEKLNINSATVEEMAEFFGVVPGTMNYVRAYRNKHGRFSSVEELLNVPRFSARLYSEYKDRIEV